MNKKLLFLQSCVRREVSTDDIGYLTKWLFQLGLEDDTDEAYFDKVAEMIEIKFFTHNNKVTDILTKIRS